MKIESVGVFCASSSDVDGQFTSAAHELGEAIVAAGWTTVYGGGGVGLMGELARTVLRRQGRIVGVRPTFISDIEGDQMGLTEMIITKTMHERIGIIFERSDAFVTLPGSCGTLDELIETITWKRLALHNKPVVVLNTAGYFDPLLDMFERMIALKFVSPRYRELYRVCATVPETIEYLRAYTPPESKMF